MMNNESRISDIEQVEQRIKNVQDDFNQIKTLRENLVNLRIQTDEIIESNRKTPKTTEEIIISRPEYLLKGLILRRQLTLKRLLKH